MAETHSKVIASRDSPGSRMLMMKINSNKTPNDITTVALERRIESCDSSRPNTSTRFRAAQHSHQIQHHYRKGIYLDTACRRL